MENHLLRRPSCGAEHELLQRAPVLRAAEEPLPRVQPERELLVLAPARLRVEARLRVRERRRELSRVQLLAVGAQR